MDAEERGRREGEEGGEGPAAVPAPRAAPSLSAAELERVIHRASELQFRAGSGEAEPALEESEVLQIGEEVGLEARHVRQALAELRADSLMPAAPRDAGLAQRVLGPGIVRASRVVSGGAAEVEAAIGAHFRDREVLKRVRSRPGRSLWEPAGGFFNKARRDFNIGGHGYELARARSVELAVEPLEEGRSLVTLTVDLRNERTQIAAGWMAGLVPAGVLAAVFLIATGGPELPFLLGSGLAGGSSVGAATWAASAHFDRRRERTELVIQGLLDRLEQGSSLSGGETWGDRFLGGLRNP